MKPSEALITAWISRMKLKAEAEKTRKRAQYLFEIAKVRPERYLEADTLAKTAARMDAKAELGFRQALKAEFGTRYRIWFKPPQPNATAGNGCTAIVWVHEQQSKEEWPVRFNKSLKPAPNPQRQATAAARIPQTYLQALDLAGKPRK